MMTANELVTALRRIEVLSGAPSSASSFAGTVTAMEAGDGGARDDGSSAPNWSPPACPETPVVAWRRLTGLLVRIASSRASRRVGRTRRASQASLPGAHPPHRHRA